MIEPPRSVSGNARSRRHVTSEMTHDSLVVWLKLSCYGGNGLEGLGAANEIQQHFKDWQKRVAKFARRPQNHYPRSVRASATSAKNFTLAHRLPASWNERSRSRPMRFKHLRRFLFFVFLKYVVKSLRSRTGAFVSKTSRRRTDKQIGAIGSCVLALPL